MKIILISPNRLLHAQWNKAIEQKVEVLNIYDEKDILSFDFLASDIILFDLDNFEDFLPYVLSKKVMCLSSKLEETKGFKLLKKGIKGYGNTYMTPLNLKEAIKIIKNDKIWIYAELMSFIIENSTLSNISIHNEKIDRLSSREMEVAKLVSEGFANKEIAQRLNITERTIKAHISSIFFKFEIKDRVTLGIIVKEYLSSNI